MLATKTDFAGVPGKFKVSVTSPKFGYWKCAKRAVRLLMSIHKEEMDCPPACKPKILELGHRAAGGVLVYITFRVPRSNGYTMDYEALMFVWPARKGSEVRAFKAIEGSEKLIEDISATTTTTTDDDPRILSPPSSGDDLLCGPVSYHGVRERCNKVSGEDSGGDSGMESSEDSDVYSDTNESSYEDCDEDYAANYNETWAMKPYFPYAPNMDKVRVCPPESEYWSNAEHAVNNLMDIHKDKMDCPPNGRPKILELGLRIIKDIKFLYFVFEVPKKNGYTAEYEAKMALFSSGNTHVTYFKKNSERPITESSDTTGGTMVSDGGGSTMDLDAGPHNKESMMREGSDKDYDDKSPFADDNKSGMMEDSDDANINETVAFLGGATERLNIM